MAGTAGLGRRGVLAFGLAAVLAACAPAAKSADSPAVRTDSGPLERRFPTLGPLSDAHWLGIVLGAGADARVPGPTDVRVVGLARLRAGGVASLVRASPSGFRPATPHRVPEALVRFMPESAGWVRSESFDLRMTGGTYTGAFFLDAGVDRVYFDTTDPEEASTPGT